MFVLVSNQKRLLDCQGIIFFVFPTATRIIGWYQSFILGQIFSAVDRIIENSVDSFI